MQRLSSVFEKVLFCYVIFLVFFIPLYPKFPLFNVSGTFVAVRLEDLLIAGLYVLWAIYIFVSHQLVIILKDKLILVLLLFWFVGALSLFCAYFITHTVSIKLGLLHYLRRVEFMLLMPVVISLFQSRQKINLALVAFMFTALAVGGYALGQQYFGWPVVSTTNSEFAKGLILYLTPGARVSSTFAGHYDLAVFLSMFIVVGLTVLFALKRWWAKALTVTSLTLSFFILVLTAARVSFVSVVVGIILSLALTGKKLFIFIFLALVISTLIYPSQLRDRFISTIQVNLLQKWEGYGARNQAQKLRSKLNIPTLATPDSSGSAEGRRFASPSSGTASDITPGEPTDTTDLGVYRSFSIRLYQEWPRAIRAFLKNPLLGSGYSSLGIATDNDFFRSLGEVGILGTASFLLIILETLKRIKRNFHSSMKLCRLLSIGVFAMIISFLINGLFIDVFESSKVASLFWISIGLALAADKSQTDD